VTDKPDVADCLDASGDKITPPNGSIVLGNPRWETAFNGAGTDNLAKLLALKNDNPQLKLIASIGGWNWSNRFSVTAATQVTRDNFAQSALAFLRSYHFDGIDIDWEFPGNIGIACTPGRVCDQPDDKRNFVLLVQTLRRVLVQASLEDGKRYYITIASAASPKYIQGPLGDENWLTALARSLDWINIMNYDYRGPWDAESGLHSALYRDKHDHHPSAKVTNGDAMVSLMLNYVPADKLVLGLAFYGYGWGACKPGPHQDGLFQTCKGGSNGAGESNFNFSDLTGQGYLQKDEQGLYTVGGQGFTRYWNDAGQVPYLYNPTTAVFISYEDEQSIHAKNNYLINKGLKGAMFWELNADKNQTLGNVVAHDLLAK
jgi:chitinase